MEECYFFSKPTTLLKVALLHGRFSRFLNCKQSTKSRKTSHIVKFFGEHWEGVLIGYWTFQMVRVGLAGGR